MTLTTKYVLTKYLMENQEDSENATLMRINQTCDQIAIRLKTTCFLYELTVRSLYWHVILSTWHVILSILSVAKLMYDSSLSHEQGFRVNEIIEKVSSYMINNNIESWIKNQGGWQT